MNPKHDPDFTTWSALYAAAWFHATANTDRAVRDQLRAGGAHVAMPPFKHAVDPALCRRLADWASRLANAPGDGDSANLRPSLRDITSQLVAAAALGEGMPEITEMRLCEAARVVLHPDQLYRFTVAPGCSLCEVEAGFTACAPSDVAPVQLPAGAVQATIPQHHRGRSVDWRVDQGVAVPVDELRARFVALGDERDRIATELALQASALGRCEEACNVLRTTVLDLQEQLAARTSR